MTATGVHCGVLLWGTAMKRSFRDRSELGFIALCKFHARKGHCCPSQRHTEHGFKLGQWVSVQRLYKDFLSVERKRRLDKLGFVWSWIEYRWEKGFAALLKFKRREGHCRVPRQDREGKFRLGLRSRIPAGAATTWRSSRFRHSLACLPQSRCCHMKATTSQKRPLVRQKMACPVVPVVGR
jgi:hypothetical protein